MHIHNCGDSGKEIKKLINPGSPYPAPPLPDIADMPFKSSSRKAGAFASLLCLALPVTFSVWSQVAGDRPGNTAVTFTHGYLLNE